MYIINEIYISFIVFSSVHLGLFTTTSALFYKITLHVITKRLKDLYQIVLIAFNITILVTIDVFS